MKDEQEYIQDIEEMRSMMQRSSKFLSLSGFAGIMAGIYALGGAFIAYSVFDFNPGEIPGNSNNPGTLSPGWWKVMFLASTVLILAIGTAVLFSSRNAGRRGEKFWDPTTRRLVVNMAVPLITGGILVLILLFKGMIGLMAPFTLLFYGLALYSASKFTYDEMKSLGLIQIGLGLVSSYFVGYGLVCWALGFGVVHIIYGIYMHYRYER